jgi:hypothetical protein
MSFLDPALEFFHDKGGRTIGDEPEQWVESARFVHVWREDASGWRVVRALSFDHKAP